MNFATPFWGAVLAGIGTKPVVYRARAVNAKKPHKKPRIQESEMPVVFTLIEKVNVHEIQRIRAYMRVISNAGQQTLFESYVARIDDDGCVEVSYRHTDPNGRGRIGADGSLSLGCIKREIRAALGHGIYYDIDIKNAHPRILLDLAERNGWPCAALRSYIENRDQHVADLKYPREIGKQIFLAVLYGGSHISVLRDANHPSHGISAFCEALKTEMASLARRVYEKHVDLHVVCAEDMTAYDRRMRVLSFVLSEKELETIGSAYRYLSARDWQIGALIHDGILVYRRSDAVIDEEFLSGMSAHVKEDIGIDLPFELKPFENPTEF